MAGTPEHAPHIPHISVPDLKGGLRWVGHHWPVVGGAALTFAGAGLAYQMFTGADRGPQTAPVTSNAPITDTVKPPSGPSVDQQPAVVINPNPPVDSKPSSPPPPVEVPKVSPVEEAIKAGKIELKEPKEWEKYFTFVSAEEGRRMLAEAREKGEFRYLLPFDPRGENVILENFTILNRQSISFTYLGVKNLPTGRDFYSSIDGNGFIGQAGNNSGGQFVATEFNPRISNNDMQMNVYVPLDITLLPPFKEQKVPQNVGVSMGNPIFSLTSSTIDRNNQKYNAVLYIAGGPVVQKLDGILLKTDDPNDVQKLQFDGADMKNLLTKGSKIAIVEKTN